MSQQRNIVIIGSGMAGYSLLREIRKLDSEIDITMICADSGDSYSKPMLSNALATGKSPDQLVNQLAGEMQKSLNFELVHDIQVTAIDAQEQRVSSPTLSWSYRQLVLAVGARPIALPIQGDASAAILTVNHLDDYRYFRDRLELARHVAIMGPGLIGCEFANDLLAAGKQVSVIGPDAWPLSTLLPEKTGHFLQRKLEQAGVRFYLHNSAVSVDHCDTGYCLQLHEGQQLEADLVLSAVGLRADLTLARQAGLRTNRGIVLNSELRSSDEHIHALGDCAEVGGYHLPFVMPIMHGARALAKTLTGTQTRLHYPPMPVLIKTPACPLVVAVPPRSDTPVAWSYEDSEDGIKAMAYRDGQLAGFALAGDRVAEKQQLTQSLPALL